MPPASPLHRHPALLGLLLVGSGGLLAWSAPVGWAAVAVHEAGHALAGLLTGGAVRAFEVGAHGRTVVRGAEPVAVLLAGHLAAVTLPAAGAALGARLPGRAPPVVVAGLLLLVQARGLVDVLVHALLSPGEASDAARLAALTGAPGVAWGLGWLAVGLLATALALRAAYRSTRSQRRSSVGPKPRA